MFYQGQQVVCVAQKNEWDPIIPSFDEALKVALGVRRTPEYDRIYTVKYPMSLFYNGKRYIEIYEIPNVPFCEKAFKPLDEITECSDEDFAKAFKLKNRL